MTLGLRKSFISGTSTISQRMIFALCSLRVLLAGAAALFTARIAEAQGSYPGLFAQAEGEAEVSGPSYALDSLILLVLVAGALYAVCRAGRRN